MRSRLSSAILLVGLAGASEVAAQPRRPAPRRTTACVPGAQHACACPGGPQGVQVCNDRGSAFGRCDCPTRPVAEAPRAAVRARGGGAAFDPVALRGRRVWYGWHTLVVDAASIAVSAIGIATANETAYWIGGGLQIIGAPIVHWTHGRVGTGFADLGLRILLPLTGALIAWAPNQSPTALTIGAAVGQVAAIVIDASVLAFETPDDDAAPRRASLTALEPPPRWSLGVAPIPHGGVVGVGLQL